MLTYPSVNKIFLPLITTGAIVTIAIPLPVYFIAIVVCTYLIILAYGAFSICSDFYLDVICHGKTTKKEIALTFDDGPGEKTNEVLALLKKHNAQASFFITGSHIEKYSTLLNQMIAEGHTIGNHSFYHNNTFPLQPAKKIKEEIIKTNQLIYQITGKKPLLFRPPFGVTNPLIKKAIDKTTMKTVGWSVRSLDTITGNSEKVARRIKKKINPGDIILLHDTGKNIIKILHTLLDLLSDNQYKLVNLEKILNMPCYEE